MVHDYALDERIVADVKRPFDDRIDALDRLAGQLADPQVRTGLLDRLDTELDRGDTRLVIYLLGAVRKIYDRHLIGPLIALMGREVDVSFRSQCAIALRELHLHSLTRLVQARLGDGRVEEALLRHVLPICGRIDENFAVHGADLTGADRRRIERNLLAVARGEDEPQVLREEARRSYEACRELSDLIGRD